MEDYWCLRWLQQERVTEIEALVLRENLVRLEGLPLALRVPSLPAFDPGMRVRLAVGAVDLLERGVSCVFREALGRAAPPQEGGAEQAVG
jgi:exoribonuclease-2